MSIRSPPLSAPSLPISPSSPWRGDKELIFITITICDPHGLWGRSRKRRSAVVVWSPAPLPSLLGGGRRIRTAPASRSQAMSKHPADIPFSFPPCCVAELHSHGTRNENHNSIMKSSYKSLRRSGESNPFQLASLPLLRHWHAAVAFPPVYWCPGHQYPCSDLSFLQPRMHDQDWLVHYV